MRNHRPYHKTISGTSSSCSVQTRQRSSAGSYIPYVDEDFEADDIDSSVNEFCNGKVAVSHIILSIADAARSRDSSCDTSSRTIIPPLTAGFERSNIWIENSQPMGQYMRQNFPPPASLPHAVSGTVSMNPASSVAASDNIVLRRISTSVPAETESNNRVPALPTRRGSSNSGDSGNNRFFTAFKVFFWPKKPSEPPAVFHDAARHSLSACGSESADCSGERQAACTQQAFTGTTVRRGSDEILRHNTMTTTASTCSGGKMRRPPLLRGFSRLRPVTTHTPCVCSECRACVTSSFDELDHHHRHTQYGYSSADVPASAAEQDEEEVFEGPIAQISRFHFAWTVGGLLTYLADFVTDISVAVEYNQEGHPWWFFWTLVFIILPSVVMAVYSCIWYFEDHRHKCACDDPHTNTQCCKHASKKEWFIRILFMLIGMAPLLRYLEAVRQAWRVYKAADKPALQRNLYILYIWADADASMLRLFEAFLESAPQLVLQLYTVFKAGTRLDEISDLWDNKAFSIMFSWVSMAFTMVQFHRSLRAIRSVEKKQVRWYGSVMMFFWHLLFIGSRVLVIVAICSSAALMGPALVFIHWLLMFGWIFSQGTTFCSERFTWQEYAYDACIAVIYIFCFFNVKDTRTYWRYVIYYCIAVPENIAGVVWYFNFATVPHGGHRRLVVLLAVLTMMFAGIFLFQMPYYYFLHPQRGSLTVSKTGAERKVDADPNNNDVETKAVNLNLLNAAKESLEAVEVQPVPSHVTWNRVLSTNTSEEGV